MFVLWKCLEHCWLAVSAHVQMPKAQAKHLAELFLQRLDAAQPNASAAPGSAEAPAVSSGGSGAPCGAGSRGAALRQAASSGSGNGSGAMQSEASGSRPCSPEPLPAVMELQGAASAPVGAVAPARWPLPHHGASQSLAPASSAPLQHSARYSVPAAHAHQNAAQAGAAGTSASAVGRKRKLSNAGREALAALLASSTATDGWQLDAAAAGDGRLSAMPVDWAAVQCARADVEMTTAGAAGPDQGAGGLFAGSGVAQHGGAEGTLTAAAGGGAKASMLDQSTAGDAAGFAAVWSSIQNPAGSSMAPAQHVPQQQRWGLTNTCCSAPLQAVAGSNLQQQDMSDEHLMTVASLGALQLQSLSPGQPCAGEPARPCEAPPAQALQLPNGGPQASAAAAAAAADDVTAGPLPPAEAKPAAAGGDQCARRSSAEPVQNLPEAVDPIEQTLQQLEDLHAMHGNSGPGSQAQAPGDSFWMGQLLWAEDSSGVPDAPAPTRFDSVTSAALVKAFQQDAPVGAPVAADTSPPAAPVAAHGSAAAVAAAEGAARGSAPPAAVMAAEVAGANGISVGSMGVHSSSGSFRMGLGAVSTMLDGLQQQIEQLEPQLTAARQAQRMSAQQHQGAHRQLLLQQEPAHSTDAMATAAAAAEGATVMPPAPLASQWA